MSKLKLRPCPFCGADATIKPWHGGRATKRLIECGNAGTSLCPVGPSVTGEAAMEAIAAWNRRAKPKEGKNG